MTNSNVEVQVLGPARVLGCAQPFRRTAALDLVVYLAFHRGGVANADWPSAIWLERTVAAATVHSTASDARRALGRDSGGSLHLPRGTRLRLSCSVVTDVDRFAALSSRSDMASIEAAFALLRGPLFAGLRCSDWAVLDGVQATLESLIVERALSATEVCLRSCKGLVAERVIRQALLVCPYDERLYRALLRATESQGDRARLRATMAQLLKLAGAADAESVLDHPHSGVAGAPLPLHPQTTSLYHRLRLGTPATG